MKNTIKIKGIKAAVGTFNGNDRNSVRIYFDVSDGEVWADVFGSGNEYNVYHSDTIYEVLSKTTLMDSWDTTSMVALRAICERYLANAQARE